MAQDPIRYCSKCRTSKPPLFARGSYTCVMCGKTRNPADYRSEMDELRAAAAAAATDPPVVRPPPEPVVEAPVEVPEPEPSAAPVEEPVAAPAEEPVAAPVEEPAAPAVEADGEICAWHECENPRRPRSKYCSRNCSNKNARWRYSKAAQA